MPADAVTRLPFTRKEGRPVRVALSQRTWDSAEKTAQYLIEQVAMIKNPRPCCRWCKGRGYLGRDPHTGELYPCACIGGMFYAKEEK